MGDRLGWDDMKRSQELADIVEETKRYSIADLR
jgi:hypothetical protein